VTTNRLEAFSDGVLAVIITVMVLELKTPEGHTWHDLSHDAGLGFLTYLLSFIYVGIYWNNHHHLFQVLDRVNGSVLWANLGLLFCLSMFPFTTNWMDEQHLAEVPVVVYGVNLFAAGAAYYVLQHFMARVPGHAERMRAVFGRTSKEIASLVLYPVGLGLAFVEPWLGLVPFVLVACLWLVPDRRVERYLADRDGFLVSTGPTGRDVA
jgi:uncharacterized membrane protein